MECYIELILTQRGQKQEKCPKNCRNPVSKQIDKSGDERCCHQLNQSFHRQQNANRTVFFIQSNIIPYLVNSYIEIHLAFRFVCCGEKCGCCLIICLTVVEFSRCRVVAEYFGHIVQIHIFEFEAVLQILVASGVIV